MPGILFLLSGPSAVGKTTVLKRVLEQIADLNVQPVVTYTTKKPRPLDINGKDYHFITTNDFLEKMKQGFFIETAQVYGNWYGVSGELLTDLEKGASYIAVVDIQGALALQKLYAPYIGIWLDANNDKIIQRLTARGTESQIDREVRCSKIEVERALARESGVYNHTIINDDSATAASELEHIIRTFIRN